MFKKFKKINNSILFWKDISLIILLSVLFPNIAYNAGQISF